MTSHPDDVDLADVAKAMLASYASDVRAHHIGKRYLPSREQILRVVGTCLELVYPGYFGRQQISPGEDVEAFVAGKLGELSAILREQIELALCYAHEREGRPEMRPGGGCHDESIRITRSFLAELPQIRATLVTDVQAALDGDPAATNLDEIILAYPGLLAVTVYRFAHALHVRGVALIPRIMTEWAHAKTGVDIHPGAAIGKAFFIDHGTGVVVGETSTLGDGVKLYQGVTLGALSHPRDEEGRVIRGTKRHPTVEDGVTIYANATVLGGETRLGAGSIVGGSVFITRSVPARSRVALKPPELRVRGAEVDPHAVADVGPILDFDI